MMKSRVVLGVVWIAFFLGISVDLANSNEPDVLKAAKSAEGAARLAAIDTLGLQGTEIEGAMAALIEMLQEDSAPVRAHAAHALGQIGPVAKPAAEALAKLIGDKDLRVRREAIRAFRKIRPGAEVAIPLFTKLFAEADPGIRITVMQAMAELGKDVVPPMIGALQDEDAAYWACLVLSEIGPDADAAVPALVRLIQSDRRPEVRREAILALAAIGPKASEAGPLLATIVRKRDEINMEPAVFALGSIGPKVKRATKILGELAEDEDTSPLLRTVTLWALTRLNPDDEALAGRVIPKLVDGFKSSKREVRTVSARALIDIDPDPTVLRPLITQVMKEASPEALDDILDALASLGEKAVPRLIEVLKTEEVRAEAAAILARIGPPAKAAVPGLIEALGDKNPVTRSEVLYALAAIGPDAEAAVPAVTKALDDSQKEVRYVACQALGKIGAAARPAKAKLVALLAADDQHLTFVSAWALANIHPECPETAPKVVPVLIAAIQSPNGGVRSHAAEALGHLGALAKEAVPALKQTAKDADQTVRDAAVKALEAIGK